MKGLNKSNTSEIKMHRCAKSPITQRCVVQTIKGGVKLNPENAFERKLPSGCF